MRYIDADALLDEVMDRHCNDCDRRKGIKNGKYRIIYSIGEAPCRACDVDDLKTEIEDAPTIEPERKKGKWIFKERREPVYDLSGVKTWGIAYMCSECGFIHTVIEDFGQYAYCPNSNCGAEMEGQDE